MRSELSDDGDEIPSDTLTATQLRQMFLSTLPATTMVEEFFERCRVDEAFRKRHLAVIESDPVLREVAQDGLKFREDYFTRLREDFGQKNTRFMIDPVMGVIDELYISLGALIDEEEKRLPYYQIMNLAFAKVKAHPNFPAGVATPSQLAEAAVNSPRVQEVYRKYNEYLLYFEDEREKQNTNADFDYEEWLVKQIEFVQELFLKNIRTSVKRLAAAEPGARLRFGTKQFDEDGKPFYPFVQVSDLDQISLKWNENGQHDLAFYIDPKDDKAIRDSFLESTEWWFSKIDRASRQDILERDLIKSLYKMPNISDEFVASSLENKLALENIRTNVLGKPYSSSPKQLVRLLELLRFQGTEDRMLGDRVGKFYQVDAVRRAANLLQLVQKLNDALIEVRKLANKGASADPGKLITTLRELRVNQAPDNRSPLRITLADRLRTMGTKIADGDALAGIEIYGYQDHPNHWALRDTFAQVRGEPTYRQILQKERRPNRWRMQNIWDNFLVKMRQKSRATRGVVAGAFVAAAVTFAGTGVYTAFNPVVETAHAVLEKASDFSPRDLSIAQVLDSLRSERNESSGGPSNSGPIRMQNRRAPTNDSLGQDGETNGPIISFRQIALPAHELPEYVNMPLIEQTDQGKYTIKKVNIGSAPYSPDSAFAVNSDLVHGTDAGLLPLPSFTKYDLVELTLWNDEGGIVSLADYSIKKNEELNMYFVEFTGFRRWWSGNYHFSAIYGPTKRPATKRRFEVDANAARTINKWHQEAGFEDLYLGLELVTEGEDRIALGEAGEVIRLANVYSEEEETGRNPWFYSNYTGKYQKFLKGNCLYLQCDGSNSLYADYINAVIDEQGGADFSFETVFGWRRQGEALSLTADTGHLHAVAYDENGNLVEYDATPNGTQLASRFPSAVEEYKKKRERELQGIDDPRTPSPRWPFEAFQPVDQFSEKRRRLENLLGSRRLSYFDEPLAPPGTEPVLEDEDLKQGQVPERKPPIDEEPEESESDNPVTTEKEQERAPPTRPDPLSALDYQLIAEHNSEVASIKRRKEELLKHEVVRGFERRKFSPVVLKDTLFLANATHAYIAGIISLSEFGNGIVARFRLRDFDMTTFDASHIPALVQAAKAAMESMVDHHPDFKTMNRVQNEAIKIPFRDMFEFIASKNWHPLPERLSSYAMCGYVKDTLPRSLVNRAK